MSLLKVIKETYYSQSVIKMLESQNHSVEIDLFDKQIISFLKDKSQRRHAAIHTISKTIEVES
jgi:hypothetical protein